MRGMESGVSYTSLDPDGDDRFQRIRQELGVSTFGLNLIRLRPGHLAGTPIARADGITLFAPADQQGLLTGLSLDYRGDLSGGGFLIRPVGRIPACACGAAFSRSSDVGRSSASISNGGSAANGVASTNGISSSGSGSEPTCCKSINCCGIRTLGQLLPAQDASSSLPPIPNSLPPKSSEAGKDFGPDLAFNGSSSSSHKSGSFSSSNSSSSDADDVWLECDDDSIAVITRKQFEEELGSKQSSTTPYLLFYQRI